MLNRLGLLNLILNKMDVNIISVPKSNIGEVSGINYKRCSNWSKLLPVVASRKLEN